MHLGLRLTPPDFGRGVAGQQVVEADLRCMELRANRRFFDLEIVAWLRPDGTHAYGQVVDPDQGPEEAPGDAVVGVRGTLVDVGLGRQQLFLPGQLWCFPARTGPAQALEQLPLPASVPAESSPPGAPAGATAASAVPSGHGVPRGQFLEALQALAGLAGLPSLDHAELINTALDLRARLAAAESKAAVAKATTGDDTTCPICLMGRADDVEVTTALIPCGHVYCGECAQRIRECATCKRHVTGRLHIYR